jgi:hypothetical protein
MCPKEVTYQQEIAHVSYEVLLFAQNVVVHIQLGAQVGNVLVKNTLVRR